MPPARTGTATRSVAAFQADQCFDGGRCTSPPEAGLWAVGRVPAEMAFLDTALRERLAR